MREYTTDGRISREGNNIIFAGSFRQEHLLTACASLYQATTNAGYTDIILNFEKCSSTFAAPMLGLCARAIKLRGEGIEIKLKLPQNKSLATLFKSANWAYFIAPEYNSESKYRGYGQVPARLFSNIDEQHDVLNEITLAILGMMPNAERGDLAALEWSLSEITDNVLWHSESEFGGLIQLTHYEKSNKLEYVIADAGAGIPNTLRSSTIYKTDAELLEYAIQEGVTKLGGEGQGNGLFGSFQICNHSNGNFGIQSGWGKLYYSKAEIHSKLETTPFVGTIINASLDLSVPHLIEAALKFRGQIYLPNDYIELHYEDEYLERININLKDECLSFGSRLAGTPVRNRLFNIIKNRENKKVYINFAGIPIISSSFADEVFGKLFIALGPISFVQAISFGNISPLLIKLVNKAIVQRCSVQIQDDSEDETT